MNNSEIIFLYDAKMTNPNGDPDEENRPRMDYEQERNIVTDLRLKRYIRDYIRDYLKKEIFVDKKDGNPVLPEDRVTQGKKLMSENDILEKYIDIRYFGATISIQDEDLKKDRSSITFIGPIQFNWGYSLNKITTDDIIEATITSHFIGAPKKPQQDKKSQQDKKPQQGTMGKDYRIKYSFIAFSGILSGKRAEHTKLTEEDIQIFDNAMKLAIPRLATRSKINQYPRLYFRIEYIDDQTVLGDLRNYIKLTKSEHIYDLSEIELDISQLIDLLNNEKKKIKQIHYFVDKDLKIKDGKIEEKLKNFNLDLIDDKIKNI